MMIKQSKLVSYFKSKKMLCLTGNLISRCFLFQAWGQIGSQGDYQIEEMNECMAIEKFKSTFRRKTGNEWFNRRNFTKKLLKYFPIEIDYKIVI